MKKLGYREMLRDRCPKVVNYSLKWCKAKEKWIDHVYSNFINVYIDKDQRNNATRIALGIEDHKHPHFDFDKTINWDDLTNEDANYWKKVSAWVKWFMVNYSYVKNTYDISKKMRKDYFDIEVKIIHEHLSWLLPSKDCTQEEKEAKYDHVDKLAEYLIECIENDNKLSMFSIFSNYLIPLYGEQVQELKPSDIYNRLRIAYNQGAKGILNNTRIISVGNDDDDYDIINISYNPEVKQWLNWVNKKITLELGKESYLTIDVRQRIAINMLDKINMSNKLKFDIRYNLIKNLRREIGVINTEDLPFLP